LRRLLVITALAAAASAAPGAASAAECTYAGSGDVDVRVCSGSYCSGGLCWTYVTPSCTGVPVDCAVVSVEIGPY
jgi:hypothetical protein